MRYLSIKAKVLSAIFVLLVSFGATTAPAHAAVRSCNNGTAIILRPSLAYGDTGTCVKVLQTILVNKGYSIGGSIPTGNYLNYTRAAVTSFQKNNGITQTGTVNRATWIKLVGQVAPAAGTYNMYLGPNYTKRVILTYDDCPKSLTAMKSMVLAAEKANVGLVLAPTGNCISSGKFDAAYARAHGQYVINHSVSHPDLATLSYANVLTQLSAPGVVTNYGRAPYGSYNTNVKNAYSAKGMRMWLWNIDTRDWEGKSHTSVVNYVNANTTARATVLMHMQWNAFTPAALTAIKSGLSSRGLSVCRTYPGTTPVKLPSSLPC